MNIKELKLNLMLLGFVQTKKFKHHWANPDIPKYTVNFRFYTTKVGKTEIDNRETLKPILDKVLKRIEQNDFKRKEN